MTTKYKVGDKVRLKHIPNYPNTGNDLSKTHHGKIGIIKKLVGEAFTVLLDNGVDLRCYPLEISLVTPNWRNRLGDLNGIVKG